MSEAKFSCAIKADFEKIWQALMEEIETPQSFNPGILGVKIIERFHDGVLRQVSVPDADVREKVVFDYEKRTVKSQLVGHPSLVGMLTKKIVTDPKESAQFLIECEFEWESVDERVDEMIRRNMQEFISRGLQTVKARAEA